MNRARDRRQLRYCKRQTALSVEPYAISKNGALKEFCSVVSLVFHGRALRSIASGLRLTLTACTLGERND